MYNCVHRFTFNLIKSAIVGKKAARAERLYRNYKRREEFQMLLRSKRYNDALTFLGFYSTEKCLTFIEGEVLNYHKVHRERMSEYKRSVRNRAVKYRCI